VRRYGKNSDEGDREHANLCLLWRPNGLQMTCEGAAWQTPRKPRRSR
jgi:hypothetical protein